MITRRLTPLEIEVEDPMAVLILGSVGLFLNIISLLFLHGKWGLRT
jgi:Co/Zn/Cd efflux system component